MVDFQFFLLSAPFDFIMHYITDSTSKLQDYIEIGIFLCYLVAKNWKL